MRPNRLTLDSFEEFRAKVVKDDGARDGYFLVCESQRAIDLVAQYGPAVALCTATVRVTQRADVALRLLGSSGAAKVASNNAEQNRLIMCRVSEGAIAKAGEPKGDDALLELPAAAVLPAFVLGVKFGVNEVSILCVCVCVFFLKKFNTIYMMGYVRSAMVVNHLRKRWLVMCTIQVENWTAHNWLPTLPTEWHARESNKGVECVIG